MDPILTAILNLFTLNLTAPGGSTPWPLRRAIEVENWRLAAAFNKERANTVILELFKLSMKIPFLSLFLTRYSRYSCLIDLKKSKDVHQTLWNSL